MNRPMTGAEMDRDTLRQQRDQLLAACEEFLDCLGFADDPVRVRIREAVENARSARSRQCRVCAAGTWHDGPHTYEVL